MAEKVTIGEVAAMLRALSEKSDERHEENLARLDSIVVETRKTNGRVSAHDTRLAILEDRSRHPQPVAVLETPRDWNWKQIGTGLGALTFLAWGAIQAIRFGLDLAAQIGSLLTHKP